MPATTDRVPFGVNLSGLLTAELGLGQAARLVVHALDAVGIPVVLNNVVLQGHRAEDRTYAGRFARENPFAINLCCLNPDVLGPFYHLAGPGYFRPPDSKRYNIAFWNWESAVPPVTWESYYSLFDEIWVPSQYTAEALSRRGRTPVTVMPYPIDLPSALVPYHAVLPAGRFNFLYVFDFNSTILRKNPAVLVHAFNLAFPADRPDADFLRPPGLTLKTKNTAANVPAKLELLELLRPQRTQPGRATLVDEDWDRNRVLAAIQQCDAYVSPHRAEGFGLTVAEAMGYARPVLMCSYSGAGELAPESCYYPVPYELRPMETAESVYDAGIRWANIRTQDLADRMLEVIADTARAVEVGRRASRNIQEKFSVAIVGQRIRRELSDRIYPSLT